MKKTFTIGRDPSCDIVLYDASDIVSRTHAVLRVDGRKMFITDLSANGTYRNGMRLCQSVEYPVTKDDDVRFANVARLDWNAVQTSRFSFQKVLPYICALLFVALFAIGFLYLNSRIEKPSATADYPVNIQNDTIPAKVETAVPEKTLPAKVSTPSNKKDGPVVKKEDKVKLETRDVEGFEDEEKHDLGPL